MNLKKKSDIPNNPYVDKEEQLTEQFFNVSHYTLMEDIPEMLCEWWSSTQKDITAFLADEGLSEFLDEKKFIDVLLGKHYFSNYFLMLVKEKIPYNVTIEKLYRSNKNFIKRHQEAELLKVDDALIISVLKDTYAKRKKARTQYIREWHENNKSRGIAARARYYLLHRDKELEYKKKYRETHKEEIRAYKQSRREIENEQQRRRYHADIEKNREKKRLYNQNMSEEQKAKAKQQKAEYDRTHRDEINQRIREHMKDENCRRIKREKDRARYKKNAKKIQAKRSEQRLQNIEQCRAKEREYGKIYREKHREEIRAKSRASYQANLEQNRLKNAEKQKQCRAKKRFRTETGPVVMSLLDAIIKAKTNISEC